MEDDDEFGDLYTDVLRPLTAAVYSQTTGTIAPASSQGRKTDPNLSSDDEEILYGASNSKSSLPNPNSSLNLKLNSSAEEKGLSGLGSRLDSGGFDLNLVASSRTAGGDVLNFTYTKVLEKGDGPNLREKGSAGPNFMEEEDGLDIVVEEMENKEDRFLEKDTNFASKEETKYSKADQNKNSGNLIDAGHLGLDKMIPGLSGKLGNHGVSNFRDDWESDESEDDLEIVLNDNNAGLMGMERMDGVHDEDDEEGEPLVIVADNGGIDQHLHHLHHQQMIDEQDWGGEEGGPGADGEMKELGDATKTSGGGVTAAPAALPPKVGYSNQMYHHPFHSQFKYVRPGAVPIPVAAPGTAGGIQGQAHPPVTMPSLAGRGRVDWRPTGIRGAASVQKGLHPNYGVPGWGANEGRGYGSGLDFTLPSHKTIFEVDIDGFEEKPWKFPGIDVSNFFNFGLNEESWKDYCKQLEQFRLGTTMQSKIRVYESGGAEQDYDPDLPPELAAAFGKQDIPSENAHLGKEEAHPSELARASLRGQLPVPMGRPIPVETGSGDRLPSIDTRRLRLHDFDTIIEIFCHSSADDDGMAGEENSQTGEDPGLVDGIDDRQTDVGEPTERIPFNVQKRDAPARKARHKDSSYQSVIEIESGLNFPSVPFPYQPDRDRFAEGRGDAKSHKMTGNNNNGENQIMDQQNESLDSDDGKINPHLSSSHTIESEAELALAVENEVNDEPVMDDRSLGIATEERTAEPTTTDTLEDGRSMHAESKQNVSTQVEQLSQENDEGQDSKTAMSSENSKRESGSSKDYQQFVGNLEDEVLQDRHGTQTGSLRRQVEDEDNAHRKGCHEKDEFGRHRAAVKRREESYSRRGGDPNSSMNRRILKSENADFRKESDMSDGSWRRREEDIYARTIRTEETRKMDHGGEIISRNRSIFRERERSERDESRQSRNELDKGTLRGVDHDHDMGLRQRDRKLRNQDEVNDYNDIRRKEGVYTNREQGEKEEIAPNHKDSSNRRKRERNGGSNQLKRDVHAKRDDGLRYVRQREEGSLLKERGERHRDRDERNRPKTKHEDVLSRRGKEEMLPDMRSGRPAEEKSWASHPRGKDNYKGSVREYNKKDGGRHVDQVKRRDRAESEISAQHRVYEDVYASGNQGSNDEKRARYERPHTSDDRAVYVSDTSRQQEWRQKDTSRKNKEFESGKRDSLVTSQRNHDVHNGQISATVDFRGRTGRENAESDIHVNRPSLRKQGEEASSDDEQIGSKRGRSKLERWTSHKERDFGPTSMLSSSKKNKNMDAYDSNGASLVQRPLEEASKILEGQPKPSVDDKYANGEISKANTNTKVEDKLLDTVEKLKKRSERFKLLIPIEKDAPATKKMENEPFPSIPTDNQQDTEIKPERPARKRRWTGN